MRDRYERIATKLDQLIWADLWEGFKPYPFAVYNQETVYLPDGEVPWDDRFLANTAIDFDGQQMAIWHMDYADEDDDVMAANLAHEMFHCFQKEMGESRYPDDLALLAYPADEQNFQMKFAENKLLAQAVRQRDLALLEQFIQLRRERSTQIGEDFQQELLVETIEGSAEFIGMNALRQLDEEKYAQKLQEYVRHLEELSPTLFQIRKISYYSGTLFLLLLQELGIRIQEQLSETKPLFALVTKEFPEVPVAFEPEEKVADLLTAEKKQKETVVSEFQTTNPATVDQKARISGYDPMNSFRMGNWLYCTNFINITMKETGSKVFLRGPILLEIAADDHREVERYFWKED